MKLFMPPNKIWGIIKSDSPSVRLSVRSSVCLLVCPSVRKKKFFLKGMPFKLYIYFRGILSRTVTQFLFVLFQCSGYTAGGWPGN